MNYNSYISYCNGIIDKTYEQNFNSSLENINNSLKTNFLSLTQKQYILQTLKNEQYRTIKKFAKYFSKINNNIFHHFQDTSNIYKEDYNFNLSIKNFNWHKVDKQEFKKIILSDIVPYHTMNARLVLYKDIINAINSIDKIILEDTEQSILGPTINNLLKQINNCGYKIEFENKDILDFYLYIDPSNLFKNNNNLSLGKLDYNPHDVYRFSTTIQKLKLSIAEANEFLQNKLKNNATSSNDTITGLLYYSLPQKNIDQNIKIRFLRIAILNSIFNTICHYSFDKDYETINNLLSYSINSYHEKDKINE